MDAEGGGKVVRFQRVKRLKTIAFHYGRAVKGLRSDTHYTRCIKR